ncbi:Uncharacterized protein BM_BM2012 [Brugia malayi]|uniref:CUE domain-containing protein n=2 Tax=Brugia TaxID=6278 RepID=A0A4E9FFE7_BRUMA|nr:Uncharacterized protein BM_BM2012 [Brugia malayi]VDO24314.1 unnamed protein product [Brugia timori]VIO92071.1 Uncharacterized protein BM_BM2012 [Brugia malayi]
MVVLAVLEIGTNIDRWISDWRYGIESLNNILSLSKSALRNRLSNDPQILELVDSFLHIFPKNWRKDEALSMVLNKSGQLDRGEEIHAVIVEMYKKILMLFLKLARDIWKQFVDEQSQQKSSLFNLNRLFRAIVIFKTSNQNAVGNIVTQALAARQFTEEDIETFIKTVEQELIDYSSDIAFSKNNVNKMESFLEKCLINFEGLTAVSSLLFNHHKSQATLCSFLNNLALFVENLDEHYCMEQIMNTSADLRGTFKMLLILVDNVITSAYALFHTLIDCLTSVDELYTVIVNCLQYTRFIFYYSIIYPIDEILNRCDEEQRIYINTSLEYIRENCTTNVLKQLKKRGLLVGLGSSANQEVQSKIDYLAELLPHFSPQFIHLSLRHFGYQTEQTANALLNNNELPLDLQALMSVELKAENTSMIVAGCSPFYDFTDDEICDCKANTSEKKLSDALICMKPPHLSTSKQEGESLGTAHNAFESKTSSIRKDLEAEFGIEAFLKERKMNTEVKNKPLFTETFDVPDSEKIALRPSYERYRYMETTSAEYNLYDDEYDDTYDDQHQNYDFDFRDGDVAIENSGIKPNTNRMQVDSDVDVNTENQEEKTSEKGSSRRKKHFKNGRQTMSAVMLDEQNQSNVCTKEAEEVKHASGSGPNERHKPSYTGGRGRQLKERHKGEFRRRQADKKMRSGMF